MVPSTLQICLDLALARSRPCRVILLGHFDALAPEQNRDPFNGDRRERVPEPVRVAIRNLCELKQSPQSLLPAADHTFERASSIPEEMSGSDSGSCLKGTNDEVGQHRVHRHSRFLRVKEQLIAADVAGLQFRRVLDPHTGIPTSLQFRAQQLAFREIEKRFLKPGGKAPPQHSTLGVDKATATPYLE